MALFEITENANGLGVEIVPNDAPSDYSAAVVRKTEVMRIVNDNGVNVHFSSMEKYVFDYTFVDKVGTNTNIDSNDVLYTELKKIAGLD